MKSFAAIVLACLVFAAGGWYAHDGLGPRNAWGVAPELSAAPSDRDAPAPSAYRFASAFCNYDPEGMNSAIDLSLNVTVDNAKMFLFQNGPANCKGVTYIGKFTGDSFTTYFFSINAEPPDWMALRVSNKTGLVMGVTY